MRARRFLWVPTAACAVAFTSSEASIPLACSLQPETTKAGSNAAQATPFTWDRISDRLAMVVAVPREFLP